MPEKTPLELLQPCLLDRLTDDEPEKKEESRRERVMSYKKYRDGVMRDLEWLLNTEGALRPESLAWLRASGRGPAGNVPDLREYPYAFRSVINYGLRQFWGLSDREKESLQDQFTEAIQMFEPRLTPGSLSLQLLNPGEEPGHKGNSDRLDTNQATLVITGELWANPLPEHLNLKTTLDLEVGQCLLGDAPHGPTPARTV
ncbi:MAG TPA: GPW/gp25 family protein [Verrucomicrobiae bacterium]